MACSRIDIGPVGMAVAANVRHLRELRQFSYVGLSKQIRELGRHVDAVALRRIEAGQRRVDVDDVMVLAVALGVSPLAVLLPHGDGKIVAGGECYRKDRFWDWACGRRTLSADDDRMFYLRHSNPSRWAKVEDHIREAEADVRKAVDLALLSESTSEYPEG